MEEADSCEKNTDMTFKASTKVTKKTIRVIPMFTVMNTVSKTITTKSKQETKRVLEINNRSTMCKIPTLRQIKQGPS